MKLVVMTFGGTSVGSIDKINNVANIVEKQLNDKKLIVVLSAMSGVTNKMQEYIDEIESNEIIENDLILTSGEAVSVGLLSAILKKRNIKSIPLLGWQIPIITDSNHQKAKILNIDKARIDQYLKNYDVIVVAGFQGVDIKARRDIGSQIRQSSKDRATLVFVAELDEAVEIADKIVVLHEGSYAGIFENKESNIVDILSLYSGKPPEALAEARGSLNG